MTDPSRAELEAIAALVERWEPGLEVVEADGEVVVASADTIDGVLHVRAESLCRSEPVE